MDPQTTLPPLSGNVLITGGAGFLGRAIIRRAHREQWPCTFTVLSRDEEKQWRLQQQYGPSIRCVIGDIRDYHTLVTTMPGHDLVIHAAAIKFIPEAERNVVETQKVNIDGSRNVARAADWCHVPVCVGISTDKASLPANVYGATKMLMERFYAEANRWHGVTRYVTVRYGNVVGSTGSIVPVFQAQLAKSGRVQVTDDRMTRFWLSADEAVDVILLAVDKAKEHPGASFIPKCGAMRVIDLARLIAGDAPIDIVGIRPGEKLHEDLVNYQESSHTFDKGDYFIIRHQVDGRTPRTQGSPPVPPGLDECNQAAEGQSGWTYRSYCPSRWITPEEMSAMIEDAKTI